jgi:hypothetical protein
MAQKKGCPELKKKTELKDCKNGGRLLVEKGDIRYDDFGYSATRNLSTLFRPIREKDRGRTRTADRMEIVPFLWRRFLPLARASMERTLFRADTQRTPRDGGWPMLTIISPGALPSKGTRVEFSELPPDGGLYLLIGEWNGREWEFSRRDTWEVSWESIPSTPTRIEIADQLVAQGRAIATYADFARC